MSQEKQVWLACEKCGHKKYSTYNSQKKEVKLELKKFCNTCGKHTLQKETK